MEIRSPFVSALLGEQHIREPVEYVTTGFAREPPIEV